MVSACELGRRQVCEAGRVQRIELRRRQILNESGVDRANIGVMKRRRSRTIGANLIEDARRKRGDLCGCQRIEFGDGKVLAAVAPSPAIAVLLMASIPVVG